ncbi:FK506-binding nuclear protein [Penaeus vannamei]|uniref:peptidylprolyl isomerase n=1 Tax=Penaeus vannamei TaxID=6689 RepID=A0A3R7PVH6_PENVA|nr:FK506-binding nuclear protein [Penaeus vannamei]
MFWGLSLDPAKRYAKVVDDAFHISAAVLDTTSVTDDEIIRVMVEVEGYETLICNLSKKLGILQCPLDLQFMEGSRIAFYTLGGAKTPEVKKAENKTPKKEAVTMNGTPKQKKPENTPAQDRNSWIANPKTMKIGGMKVEELKVGKDQRLKPGNMVFMYYEGRFPNGKMFDKCQVGKGFGFRLGRGEVIKGWDMAIVGMQPGGKRKIVCPPKMAYGERGAPPDIPPNSTLIFNIELKTIK